MYVFVLLFYLYYLLFFIFSYSCTGTASCNQVHGGCDSLVTCTENANNNTITCGPCPVGFNGTGNTSCTIYLFLPLLTLLNVRQTALNLTEDAILS